MGLLHLAAYNELMFGKPSVNNLTQEMKRIADVTLLDNQILLQTKFVGQWFSDKLTEMVCVHIMLCVLFFFSKHQHHFLSTVNVCLCLWCFRFLRRENRLKPSACFIRHLAILNSETNIEF